MSVTLAYNLIFCNDGIARKYWNKGLYHKGSYTYKSVTIKYGTTIKITSRSFKMTKAVFKESCGELLGGVKVSAIIAGAKSVINKIMKGIRKILK